jgi:3-deoxy-manno-octulosonate cytidylyltransferase (CMP-KDO synthetase)
MSVPAAQGPVVGGERRAVAILPARLASRRLPRKMLLAETGKPLFVHTAERVAACRAIQRVVVATDAREILEAARDAGLEALLTREDHESGTDRVQEAFAGLGGGPWDVVLGVQADEPEVETADLEVLVAAFAEPEVEAASLCAPFEREEEAEAPQAVKVVRDSRGDALYFSRAPIPYRAAAPGEASAGAYARAGAPARAGVLRRHVGVYAFRPAALARFCALPSGALEGLENLEQLRWLEAGRRMRVLEVARAPMGIDTRADYDLFVARLRGSP